MIIKEYLKTTIIDLNLPFKHIHPLPVDQFKFFLYNVNGSLNQGSEMPRRFDEIEDDEITPEMLLLQNDDEDELQSISSNRHQKVSVKQKDKSPTRVARNSEPRSLPDTKEISTDQLFTLALRDFRKGDYAGVVNYLTPFVEDEPSHILAHKLLAYALIETGFFKDAERVVGRILSFNRNDAEALNIRSYLSLQQGELEPAINDLLDALYVDEDHPVLKRNLESIRNLKDAKLASALLKPKEFIYINLPEENYWDHLNLLASQIFSSYFFKLLGVIVLFILLGILFYANYPALSNWLSDYRMKRGLAVREFKRISIKDIDKLVAERKPGKLYLTADEVKKKFSLIRVHLQKRHFNKSRLLMNELLYSNAAEKVKEHVRIFESFLPDVNLQSLDFVPSYQDVAKSPMLYRGMFVRWSGTIANLQHIKRKETTFDLLINFVNEAIVEGIAETHFHGFVHLMNGEKITIFGEIAGLTVDNKVIIKGQQVLRLGKK